MESLLWNLNTLNGFSLGEPFFKVLMVVFILCWDYPLLVPYYLFCRVMTGINPRRIDPTAQLLPVLVVIPSLLRKRDELTSLMSTVRSLIKNGYGGAMTIVISIDGYDDAPKLYAELRTFADRIPLGARQLLFITGTPMRRSKPMAIEQAIEFTKALVAKGTLPAFPPVYISTDADADLGPNALEAIVLRLQRRHLITRAPARIVAGALHVRGDNFWQGWRHFFSIGGQLNLQVAREYYVSNVARHNIRLLPLSGVPGAFYCTWSEIFLTIPNYFGYMRTLRTRDWLMWWLGKPAPKFSETKAAPIPELMAGDTDDTVTAYLSTIARWDKDHFTFDPPRTPFHALYYMLITIFLDRSIQYEPRARVYTSSPTTVKTLLKQRKRWNTSRVELTGRFWRSLGYHWSLGLPVMVVKLLLARSVIVGAFVYFLVPVTMWKSNFLTGVVLSYIVLLANYGLLTFLTMLMNDELKFWRLMLALPFSPFYVFLFNWIPGFVGVTSDVLLFGNVTGFSPETTLKRGKSVRIALLFRIRRCLMLMIRSVTKGDVPLGKFWIGWGETPWTPSGFEGWTTGDRPRGLEHAHSPIYILRKEKKK